jgi:2,3-bisphosphoglycerate-independent phosphoglycerate mutase
MKRTTLLVILDGFGYREEKESNAIAAAQAPVWARLWSERPHTLISGSGRDVGLPAGQMGNSEVGHMNLGAGRVVYQDLTRITHAIEQGEFARNHAFLALFERLRQTGGALHVMGLLSPGGFTATKIRSSRSSRLQLPPGSKRSICTLFLMVATHRRAALNLLSRPLPLCSNASGVVESRA